MISSPTITWIFTGRGHPILDLMCMYSHYIFHPSLLSEKEVIQYLGMTAQEGRDVYDRFLEEYTRYQPDFDKEDLQKLKADIIRVHAARFCIMAASNPRLFSPRAVDKARGRLARQQYYIMLCFFMLNAYLYSIIGGKNHDDI